MNFPETNKPVVCVLSGGLDSTVLVYALAKKYNDVRCIAFNYGQRHNVELKKATITVSKLGLPFKIIDISFLEGIVKGVCSLTTSGVDLPTDKETKGDPHANFVVPYRNMIFQSIALAYCESIRAEYLFMGIQNGDDEGFWDCREPYYKTLNNLTSQNDLCVTKVLTPFLKLTKVDEIKLGMELGVPFEDTWTCYAGGSKPCGACHSCVERNNAFKSLGMEDPLNGN